MILKILFPLISSSVVLGITIPDPANFHSSLNPIEPRYKRDIEENYTIAQNNETTDETIETNLNVCNEKQLEEYYSDLNVCKTEATQNFSDIYWEQGNDYFHSTESDKVLCNKYIAQASCYTEGGPRKLTCFDDNTNRRKKLEFLYEIWKTVANGTSGFGNDFIDSCSAFSNFEQDYLKLITGCENCCSLEDYVEKVMKSKECKKNTNQSRDKRFSIYDTMPAGELKW